MFETKQKSAKQADTIVVGAKPLSDMLIFQTRKVIVIIQVDRLIEMTQSYDNKLDQDALKVLMPTEQVGGFGQCSCFVMTLITLSIMTRHQLVKGSHKVPLRSTQAQMEDIGQATFYQ